MNATRLYVSLPIDLLLSDHIIFLHDVVLDLSVLVILYCTCTVHYSTVPYCILTVLNIHHC